jgi:peptide/nickel transport system substrate-binding protein
MKTLVSRLNVPPWAATLYGSATVAERIALGILAVLLVISGTVSVVQYIQNHTVLVAQAGGTYREAAVGQPRYLNPILASANDLDVDITQLVYSGLFRYTEGLKLTNDLAESFEVSADQTEYTITLRPNVSWHDGESFNADDVVFTIRSIQTRDYGSPLFSTFQGVTVEKIDDQHVRFKLTSPYAPFLNSLTVGIAPEHVWSQIEPSNAALTEQMLKPVGTGPFKFSEITTRRRTGDITNLELVRNENYYAEVPYLDGITFSFYTTHEEAIQAFQAGNVDGIGFLPLQLLDQVQSRSRTVHHLLLPQYFGLFFNQQNNEAITEAGVRAALALAVNREEIVHEALRGYGEPLHLPIPLTTLTRGEESPVPTGNSEAAKQNLAESGWEDQDNDGIREKDGKQLALKITTTDWPDYVKTAEIIQRQWQAVGVRVELEHLGAGTIQQTAIQPREYEVLLFGQILPAEPDPYPFWHSTQTRSPGLNLALFKNEDVDRLLEEARKQPDRDQRQEKLAGFENKILELNPAIILYQPYYLFAATSDMRGINANLAALPAGRFNNITQWHLSTKRIWRNNQEN